MNKQTGLAYGQLPGRVLKRVMEHKAIEAIGTLDPKTPTFVDSHFAETWKGLEASSAAVTLLGIRPVTGSAFNERDYSSADALMISEGLWHGRFGWMSSVVGRRIWFDGQSSVVVGVFSRDLVLPAFPQPMAPDFLQAGQAAPGEAIRDGLLAPIVRLREGVTFIQAREELHQLTHDVATDLALPDLPLTVRLLPLRDDMFWRHRTAATLFAVAAAIIVGVATLNLMHVFAIRQRRNVRALAVCAANGATHGVLVRSAFSEGLVIAGIGALLSFVVASWLSDVHVVRMPDDMRVAVSYMPVRQAGGVAGTAVLMVLLASLPSAYAAGTVDISRVVGSWRGTPPSSAVLPTGVTVDQARAAVAAQEQGEPRPDAVEPALVSLHAKLAEGVRQVGPPSKHGGGSPAGGGRRGSACDGDAPACQTERVLDAARARRSALREGGRRATP